MKKLLIVVVWVVIVLGIYRCSTQLTDTKEDITENMKDGDEMNNEHKNENEGVHKDTEADENVPETPFDENVRILLMNQGYHGIYHTELRIACSEGMIVEQKGALSDYAPDSEVVLSANDFKYEHMICITGKNNGRLEIKNIGRNSPAQYRGKLECYLAAEGIVVINELLVEEYLYGVVPSEMPSTYPEEALKAQAISARTYTYFHKQSYAYPEWKAHMDDSTAFQVYMNCEESPRAVEAVDETKNQVLTYEGNIVESFYYSTSGGYNGGAGVWKDTVSADEDYLIETGEEIYASNSEEGEQAYRQYIVSGNSEDIEYDEAWYRWNYDKALGEDAVKNFLKNLYKLSLSQPNWVKIRSRYLSSDQLQNEPAVRDIRVLNRKKSGMVAGIIIETEHFRVSVMSQYVIRQALGCTQDILTRKDGSSYIMGDILPSAYFYIEKIYDNTEENGDTLKQIIIHGAGFGHGCGMSQNGAKGLADKGLTAAQILAYYYKGSIKT
ncbi:MAG: SpoIID/LytB domain-containing protein, partial [Lachnospiraceae bacterium]|nr:SpoIID/LytB domain-containing protein [Lachnospiraceae bacterium]